MCLPTKGNKGELPFYLFPPTVESANKLYFILSKSQIYLEFYPHLSLNFKSLTLVTVLLYLESISKMQVLDTTVKIKPFYL